MGPSSWLLSCFFFSSRRRHTRFDCDWSSDVCSSDLDEIALSENASLDGFMHKILGKGYFVLDQWQLEKLAHVRRKARACYVTDGLPRSEERRVGKERRSRWSRYECRKECIRGRSRMN